MNSIKIIVTDLDGTLLDDQKRMPKEMPALLDIFDERGIRFIAASGRQYYNIRKQFGDMADRIDYIAENGGMVGVKDEIIFCDEIDKDMLRTLIGILRETEGCWPILCGEKCAYYEDGFEEMTMNVNMYYASNRLVDDILAYLDEDVFCKIAIYASHDAEFNAYPAMLPFADRMQVALSGDCWVDVMNSTVDKGAALTVLLDRYGISPDDCMGFGDYLNDLPMLKLCGHAYAMENAHEELREQIAGNSGNNNDNGVVKTICKELGVDIL